jgi:N-acyl-D-amino-acid deacylase
MTGDAVASLASYDRFMQSLMQKWKIPGASVAVTKDGRLVFARGYGYANKETKQPVAPDALFRIASVSKPLTAIAVLRLVEEHKLDLNEPAFAALAPLEPPPGGIVDSRLHSITVRQLMNHTGGWDRDRSFDAMFIPERAAAGVGAPSPADATTVIRYMLGQKLDFDPGARFAYSNLGYAILGRILERRTGLTYAEVMHKYVLDPAGVTRMKLGRTLKKFRPPEEVCYYDNNDEKTESVFPYVKDKVAWPDGGFYLEAMDAHGAWTASAIDLVRIVAALEGRGAHKAPLLTSESRKTMLEFPQFAETSAKAKRRRKNDKPKNDAVNGAEKSAAQATAGAPAVAAAQTGYALGWNVRLEGSDANWWHTGSLPGTTALLVRAHNGLTWAVLFNSRPEDYGKFQRELDPGCWAAAAEVKDWPTGDLFEKFK